MKKLLNANDLLKGALKKAKIVLRSQVMYESDTTVYLNSNIISRVINNVYYPFNPEEKYVLKMAERSGRIMLIKNHYILPNSIDRLQHDVFNPGYVKINNFHARLAINGFDCLSKGKLIEQMNRRKVAVSDFYDDNMVTSITRKLLIYHIKNPELFAIFPATRKDGGNNYRVILTGHKIKNLYGILSNEELLWYKNNIANAKEALALAIVRSENSIPQLAGYLDSEVIEKPFNIVNFNGQNVYYNIPLTIQFATSGVAKQIEESSVCNITGTSFVN